MALITEVPEMPKLNLLTVAEATVYIALSKVNPLSGNEKLRQEDLFTYIHFIRSSQILTPCVSPA
jgi:hypothetical protein